MKSLGKADVKENRLGTADFDDKLYHQSPIGPNKRQLYVI